MNTSLFVDKIRDVNCTLIVFCYIFSFYIVGPLTSSIVVAIPFICKYAYSNNVFDKYSLGVFMFLISLIFTALLYSCIHLTFDFSYLKTLIGQFVNMSAGMFVAYGLRRKFNISALDVEKFIVLAFLIQSIIQLVASIAPTFASMLLPFNRAYDFAESDAGKRGLALATGTGWSLGLCYGIVYIVFVKRYLLSNINLKKISCGVLLLAGTMFAGRTGFAGAIVATVLFFLNANESLSYKFYLILKILIGLIIFCILFYFIFPTLSDHLVNNVFPFAFEPLYRLFYNDEFGSLSTDALDEMWNVPITFEEILLGTGCFENSDGSYYMHIDIGIKRNLFYWGILGYGLLILYQLYLGSSIKSPNGSKKDIWNGYAYRIALLAFICMCDYKAMTIGYNKMAMSIIYLLGYFYYNDSKKLGFGYNTVL